MIGRIINGVAMKRWILGIAMAVSAISLLSTDGFAQGPPINTDSPIVLGLSGRAVRTFGKLVRVSKLLKEGEQIADPNDSKVTLWETPIALPYNFTDRLQVAAIVPFLNATASSRAQSASNFGLGDLRFYAKYVWYQSDGRNKTFRIASRADVKLPTGEQNKAPALGTGSTDVAFSSVAGWIEDRVGLYLEGGYSLNTSSGAVNYGNSVFYNLAVGYRLLPAVYETYPSPQLNGFLELNGTTTARNTVGSVRDANSGGTTLFLSPGLQYVGGRLWLVEASYQYPIVREPNGTQLAVSGTVSLGVRVLLY